MDEIRGALSAVLLATVATAVFYDRGCTTRLTDFFVVCRGRIRQEPNKSGRGRLRLKRRDMKGKSLDLKLYSLGKLLRNELLFLSGKLEQNKAYVTVTHLKAPFEHGQRKGLLQITSIGKTKKRFLREAISFLGWRDVLKTLFSRDRDKLYKQFYKIKFERAA